MSKKSLKELLGNISEENTLVFDVDNDDKGYIFQIWLFMYGISIVVKLYNYVKEDYIFEYINAFVGIITIMYGLVLIKARRKSNKELMNKLKDFEYRIIQRLKKSDDYVDDLGIFVKDSFKRKNTKRKWFS